MTFTAESCFHDYPYTAQNNKYPSRKSIYNFYSAE